MGTKRFVFALLSMVLLSSMNVMAQRVDLEIHVKGIEEAKGKVMIALGDLNEPQKLFTGIKEVTETGELTFLLQGVPDGWETELNVLHDLDGDTQLHINANGIPTEPCAKAKVEVSAENPVVEITLMDVLKMIGG
jgi:uncharacterized protein (DUF2141 family)